MKLATFPEVYEDAVRRLARALGGLKDDQLRVARANARLEVRRSLEALRRRLDEAHPVVPKAPKERAKPRPAGARIAKLKAAGWGNVANRDLIIALGQAGIRVRNVGGSFYAPKWAVFAALDKPLGTPDFNVRRVVEARRSTNVRKAILAAHALGGLPAQGAVTP